MRSIVVKVAFLMFALSQGQAYSQGRLHAIIVVDTKSDDIEPQMITARKKLEAWLKGNVEWNRLRVSILDGQKFSDVAIDNAIAQSQLQPQDSLLFYYVGHGYIDQNNSPLLLPDDDPQHPLYVGQILGWLRQKPAVRRVVIFDMCQTQRTDIEIDLDIPNQSPLETSPFIESLFFSPSNKDYHCLISSAPGESALSVTPSAGGGQPMPIPLFTNEFVELAEQDMRSTWQDLLRQMKERVSDGFREGKDMGLQVPGTNQTVTEIP